ncbi:MAG: hypothetical protein WBG19_07350 [Thermoplasmata archaeon]
MGISRALLGIGIATLLLSLVVAGLGAAAASPNPQPLSGGTPATFDVTFDETGLAAGTNWSVHVAFIGCGCSGVHTTVSSVLSTLPIPLPNGSYHYNVLRVPGYAVVGVAHGTVAVAGATQSVSLVFAPIVRYSVEFTEVGLPHTTSWTVHVWGNGKGQVRAFEDRTNSSTGAAMNFSLPNASYHYSVDPVNGSFFNRTSHGTFSVAGSAPSPIEVRFITPETYEISFAETGLLAGMSWSVQLQGRTAEVDGIGGVPVHEGATSTGPANPFFLPNGTYHFRIGAVIGYSLSTPDRGVFTVTGAAQTIGVSFAQVGSAYLYLVDFSESGLATGTSWSVHVAVVHTFGRSSHETSTSTGSTVSFALQNGTYRFQVLPVRGYTLGVSTGFFTVNGSNPAPELVSFTPVPTYTVTFNETGLPNGTNWTILVHTQAGAGSVWPVRTTETSNATVITFTVPNGTYCYRVYAIHGWHLLSGSLTGTFVVAGASPPTTYLTYTATA